ncbi:peroxidase family protein [Tardiphaga sp. 42S5]|uniref:peroxidase family protein n=1 Tax=Tardiphaga sp. 42S5 TaxID=1404799 RepID=UPI002A59CFC5|nr:peroxidase family protein [Tardiphaga sp. 42S5]WPO43209.1 peroxidase family protein [Tardiphaga sp. 42S5]
MVSYIRSDLDFILAQIKIAEDHALFERTGGAQGKPLFGPTGSIPTYNLSWGLRTVDGTYNNLLNPELGAADNEFPEGLGTQFRTIMVDPDGPGPAPMVPVTYTPGVDNDGPGSAAPGDVFDPYVRTISNLIVDQTLGNPSAILTGLQRAGIVAPADQMAVTAQISAAYAPLADEFKAVSDAERADAEAQAALSASPGNPDLQAAAAATAAALSAAQAALDTVDDDLMALLTANGIELEGANVKITNTAPDEGLSAPFNSWFTLFGQFFDHGLDLVAKGGNGTVFIPLMPDDPLYVPGGTTNFMVLTRATLAGPGADGVMGTADDTDRPVNTTTSFVDQNQTYTSHPSHQVFLREYELNAAGEPVATGRLIEGANGGMATWADLKAQARNILGIELVDAHVGNLPLLATDQYGNFIPDPITGFPQVVMAGPPQFLASGTPDAPLSLVNTVPDGPDADALPDLVHLAVRTGHAFLADIAHNAVPTGLQDGDIEIGLGNGDGSATDGFYDNELLDAHFVAGDGRANENIGLTAVHHVFHSEHNRLAEHTKAVVLADATALLDGGASQAEAVAFLNEWLIDDVASVPASPADLIWDGERLFQAAKFGTEMQYQHLVFEEFARKIQPNINVFLVPDGYDVTLDPSIVAEFAHVVYRFGHSMLTETIDRFDPTFNADHIGLIEGFLNPLQFMNNGTTGTVDADIAAGAIIRGMTRQAGNQIDEFVTSALRNNLLGLPLDLATINLARGRDTGVPTLNEARQQFYEATNEDSLLKPYESWVDFAGHLKNEASIINFIASYGTHALITSQATLEGKRDAALTIISGVSVGGLAVPADASDFLNGLGAYGAAGALGGLNNVDLWIGGLAEATMPFGGMLGSTFNFVFEVQMENLQSGDRFYYLQRLDGLHLFGEMENNSFAALIMRNTDATHLPSDVFSTPGLILEVDTTRQFNDLNGDGILESTDPVGGGILTPLVVRNDPTTPGTDTNYLRYTGGEHVVLGGTELADTLIAGIGDDTLFGDGGNDKLEGGFGNDIINGGDGDDIIKDSGGDDNIKAGAGNDVVHAGPGLDLVMGNDGQDFIFLGTDMGSEVFAGTGNDFIYGNKNAERILGNEGNDWIETGTFDGAPGDNFDEIFSHDTIDGHDVFLGDGGFDEFIGEGGDEIFVGSAGRGKMVGMSGFDWATYKDNPNFVNADLSIPIIFDEAPTLPQNAALDEYESVEGLSGTRFNDVLTGTNLLAADRLPTLQGGTEGYQGSALDAEGIALIAGLQAVLGAGVTEYSAGDIILGGDGSDRITGQEGDDIIDGDKWLDVQIGVFAPGDTEHAGTPIALHNSMTTLAASMFNGTINPGQLGIVRTIRNSTTQEANGETVDSNGVADVDTAVFSGARAEYDITFNPNGTLTVAHTGGLATDGTDTLRNIEVLDFTDQDISLLAPTLDLNGDVTTTTTTTAAQAYRDTFDTAAHNNSNGSVAWGGTPWIETNDTTTGNVVTGGQIQLDNGTNELRFTAGDGAQITRTVNLSGVTTATLSFDYDRNNGTSSIDAGESIVVQYSQSGSFAPGSFTVLTTINETSGGGDGADTFSVALNLTGAGPNSAIRFVSSAISAGEYVLINNFNIATTTTTTTTTPGTPGNNYVTNYAENGAAVAIAAGSRITDDGVTIASARVILTNASAGDLLTVLGGLPGGITSAVDASVAGQITLTLTGSTSLANYQTAIGQVRYSNNSENPTVGARTLQVTVNDGLLDSAVATTTVNVTATNDAPAANNDTVITNVAANTSFSILQAALLANDTDPEGSPITITAVGGATGLAAGPALGAGVITLSDDASAGGSFTYTGSDGTLTDPATVTINRVTTANITGTGANDIIVGNTAVNAITGGAGNDHINAGDGGDTVSGGTGSDIILAGTGNDTINWNANAAGDTDGFDMVNGEAGATDTFVVNGRAGTAETFIIYARAAALAAGVQVTGADSEIIITRTVAGTTTVIAELDNIEEISVNTLNTTINNGNNPTTPDGGTSNGDTIQVIGNFNAPFTSLNFSTITIDGNAGDDTVDISALTSAHRIVFRSNGGNDTIIGTLRPQDVIRLPEGAVPGDYEVTTDASGVTTMTNASQSISFTSPNGLPQFGDHDDEDDDDTAGNDDSDDDCDDDDDTDTAGSGTGGVRAGTAQADVLVGTAQDDNIVAFDGDDIAMGHAGADAISAGAGADFVNGGDGRDVIFAGIGDDQVFGGGHADIIYGDAGADRILGEAGNDLINAGAGDDSVFGGAGNDLIVAEIGDGNDVYFGDDSDGGNGIDTLDMSAATVNVTVNLGSGPMSNGTASSSQTGNDTIWGIENVNTGSGSDTITASNAVNVIHGGAGGDTFRFTSASAAEGDTILSFEPGDRLDLTAIDASIGTAGDQSFTLVGGAAFTAAGQLAVTFETRENGEFTVVQGNIDGNTDADFKFEVAGHHNLTATNVGL